MGKGVLSVVQIGGSAQQRKDILQYAIVRSPHPAGTVTVAVAVDLICIENNYPRAPLCHTGSYGWRGLVLLL